MKHPVLEPLRLKVLPIVIASSIGLIGCDANPNGEINGGLSGGIGGSASGNALLLAGGVIGLSAILNSSSDGGELSSPNVNGQSGDGGDSDNGDGDDDSGNGDSGNGDGDSGSGDGDSGNGNGDSGSGDGDSGNGNGDSGSGDGDSGNGNGDSGSGDGDSGNGNGDSGSGDGDSGNGNGDSGSGDSDSGLFAPPAWMSGMWRGTATDGSTRIAYATVSDIGLGGDTSVQSYSAVPGISSQVSIQSDSTYEYTVSFPGANGTTRFTENWTNNNDGSALYTATGDRQDQYIVYQVAATDFINPPQWLQGDWAGNGYRASISEGNISYGAIGSATTNLFDVASQPGAVVLVKEKTGIDYVLEIITRDKAGKDQSIQYSFGVFDANSITFINTADKTPVVMIRQ